MHEVPLLRERDHALVARLLQSVPLVIALVVLAIVVYVFVAWVKSPLRAKEILIKLFTVITIVLSVAFGLASLYAFFEHNVKVLEITGTFLVVSLVALGITRICRWRFVKRHPAVQEQGHAHEISLEVSNDRLVCHFSSARNWMFMVNVAVDARDRAGVGVLPDAEVLVERGRIHVVLREPDVVMCQVRKVIAKQVLHAAIDHGRVARFLDARTEGRGILRHLLG